MKINRFKYSIVFALSVCFISCTKTSQNFEEVNPVVQISIKRVEGMPNLPEPFKILDFNQLAKDYDSKVYDPDQTGKYWPLIWTGMQRRPLFSFGKT